MEQEYFDFKEEVEESEDLDFDKLVECPHCHKPIPHNSILCLYCGKSVSFNGKRSSWTLWIALFLIIAFLAVLIF